MCRDLDNVFACVRVRGRKRGDEYFIEPMLAIEEVRQMGNPWLLLPIADVPTSD
jgi:hypothetical protein